ncbi:MAG TPA: phenylpyruvate tautomerase MIF-related protein [Verrucomicrobiae bacterium]|nr:phenylpyruvate tautomerase MIF-related protein [Verrucomicrobiae bacterium]
MPLLKIQTNQNVPDGKRDALLKKVSRAVAQQLAKPEQYMMVSLTAGQPMVFAGTSEPAAFMDLRAIGLPSDKTEQLAALLCDLARAELGVAKERVYINFTDVPANLWGWNGETF